MAKFLGLDDRLAFFPTNGTFIGDDPSKPYWYIAHQSVWDDSESDYYDCLPYKFGRKVDADRAIKALGEAKMTTARKMWSDLTERDRIVGEAMAW